MIQLTLGPRRAAPDDDGLSRSFIGWCDGLSDQETYEAGRGAWVLGAQADRETYALICAQGVVRLAVEIQRLVPVGPGRRAIEGEILRPGHEIHDRYVGQPSPAASSRNPVAYVPDPDKTCGCGCGASTSRDFLPGHDQRAIHERITRDFGTVLEFLHWYDGNHPAPEVEPVEAAASAR